MTLSLFDYKAQIDHQLERLQVNTDSDSYSGLMTTADYDKNVVVVYDDYASESYRPDKLLAILRNTDKASLDPDSFINIWEIIRPAAV